MRRKQSLLFLLILSACLGDKSVETGPTPTQASLAPPIPSPGTKGSPCPPTAGGEDSFVHLVDVRTGSHGTYDRVTFEFRATSGGKRIPKYQLESATPPFTEDASGEPIAVEGNAFARIIFHGATGVDLDGETPRQTYTGPKEIKPGFDILVEAQETGDFEATLSWVFGLSRSSCWSVQLLEGPLRFVLDFLH